MRCIQRVGGVAILLGAMGVAAHAAAADAPFRAGATPPYGEMRLTLEGVAGNGNYTSHFEQSSMVWSGRTVDLWIFLTLNPSLGVPDLGAWRQIRIDCDARARMIGSDFPVDASGALMQESTASRQPMSPIVPDSMDESFARILCDGHSFNFDTAVSGDVPSAAAQGHAELERTFP